MRYTPKPNYKALIDLKRLHNRSAVFARKTFIARFQNWLAYLKPTAPPLLTSPPSKKPLLYIAAVSLRVGLNNRQTHNFTASVGANVKEILPEYSF
ncbi:MAG TPA: hypothetical protein V6D13_13520 [Halomicronema sp.]